MSWKEKHPPFDKHSHLRTFSIQGTRWNHALEEPWVREILWRKEWESTPVFLPGEFHGQRSLAGCSSWGHKSSWGHYWTANTHTHTHTHTSNPQRGERRRNLFLLMLPTSCWSRWSHRNLETSCPAPWYPLWKPDPWSMVWCFILTRNGGVTQDTGSTSGVWRPCSPRPSAWTLVSSSHKTGLW